MVDHREVAGVAHVVVDDQRVAARRRRARWRTASSGSSRRPGRNRRRRRGRARRAPPPAAATGSDDAVGLSPRSAQLTRGRRDRSSGRRPVLVLAREGRHGPGHARAGSGAALRVHAVGRAAQARARGRGGDARVRPLVRRDRSRRDRQVGHRRDAARLRLRAEPHRGHPPPRRRPASSAPAAIPRRSWRPSALTPTTCTSRATRR